MYYVLNIQLVSLVRKLQRFLFSFRLLAATVFRPNGARKAFPCFDEPHIRAPFRVSVFRDRFHIGLSNSIVHTTEDVGFYMGTGLVSPSEMETHFP